MIMFCDCGGQYIIYIYRMEVVWKLLEVSVVYRILAVWSLMLELLGPRQSKWSEGCWLQLMCSTLPKHLCP